ncbi:MAG: hypothetical protein ACFBRM_04435 [Pikeienuella sp.]
MTRFLTAAAVAIFVVTPAAANEFAPQLKALAEGDIRTVVSDPIVIEAIRAQNAETAGLSEADILSRDRAWRDQIGASVRPLIDDVLTGSAADLLRAHAEASTGTYTEIFVMDAVGLNVAASAVTSDYWQGDEAKWQDSFTQNAVHIGEIEFDESTQSFQSQVSVPVHDPATGKPIGAATFGVNIELLD